MYGREGVEEVSDREGGEFRWGMNKEKRALNELGKILNGTFRACVGGRRTLKNIIMSGQVYTV